MCKCALHALFSGEEDGTRWERRESWEWGVGRRDWARFVWWPAARGWTGILRQCLSSPLFFVRAHPNNKSMLNEPVSHERGSSLAVSCCCRVRACRVRACTMHELSPCCALETPVMDIVPNKLSKCSSAHTHEHSQYHISKTPARVFACVSVCVCTSPSRPSLSVLHTRPSLPLRSAHALHMRRRGRCDCARPHTARTAGTSATHSLLTYHSQP